MNKTWILVAHRAGARLFESTSPNDKIALIQDIQHPEGQLKDQDINSDKDGRSFDAKGAGRHAMEPEVLPHRHLAERFAKRLANLVEQGRTKNAFSKLILVSEPRFLGVLKHTLNGNLKHLVVATLGKDLAKVPDHAISLHLKPLILQVHRQQPAAF